MHFKKEETKRFCVAVLSMDGSEITDEIFLRDDGQCEWKLLETSKRMGRPFKFSPLNVTGALFFGFEVQVILKN